MPFTRVSSAEESRTVPGRMWGSWRGNISNLLAGGPSLASQNPHLTNIRCTHNTVTIVRLINTACDGDSASIKRGDRECSSAVRNCYEPPTVIASNDASVVESWLSPIVDYIANICSENKKANALEAVNEV